MRSDLEKKSKINTGYIFLGGAAAGVGSWIFTYPIDVVKTHMQASKPDEYKGFLNCAINLIKETKNIKPFFTGLAPAIYRAFVMHSVSFVVYERVLTMLKENNP